VNFEAGPTLTMNSDHGMVPVTHLHVVEWGKGEPVVIVHGSFGWGEDTFGKQRPLSDQYKLLLVDRRGFGKSPAAKRVDFDSDADDIVEVLGEGAHLVGHSYGAIVCLVAAGRKARAVKSLTVIEPPAFQIAMNDPVVESAKQHYAAAYATGTHSTPQQFYANFIGTDPNSLPSLSEEDISAIRSSMTERPPWEADIPLEEITQTTFPKLVVSGGRQRTPRRMAFVKICDILEEKLRAQRLVFEGALHNPQFEQPEQFNTALRKFLDTASARSI
jgi:pimeloyl-ACP methyl ester carboxylesterase